jgi:hypothetical protein
MNDQRYSREENRGEARRGKIAKIITETKRTRMDSGPLAIKRPVNRGSRAEQYRKEQKRFTENNHYEPI